MKGETSFKVVHESVLVPKSAEHPRSGEGAMVELGGGRLALAYTSYTGATDDHAPANLVWRTSEDGGVTWGSETLLLDRGGSMNVMSVSLLREESGRILCLFLRKEGKGDILRCIPEIMSSDDNGKTWSAPRPTDAEDTYHIVNNDRLVRLSTGRLVVPSAHNPVYSISEGYSDKPTRCLVLLSDDGGLTWRRSASTRIDPDKAIEPPTATPEDRQLWRDLRAEAKEDLVIANQEPGVVELPDGRLMMWCRSNLGHMFRAYSNDKGETWSALEAVGELVTPCAPQSIKMIPGTDLLLCVYNDRRGVGFGNSREWWNRTPLTLAVSADLGKSWKILGDIEGREHNYCYTSMLFHGGNLLLSYYQSVEGKDADGNEWRNNLSSLKIKIIETNSILERFRK